MNKKIAFLDRDGVINKKAVEHQYITKSEDFLWNEGIFNLVEFLISKGFEIIIVTNQRGIARGIFSKEELLEVHKMMSSEFKKHGFLLLDILYCPHEENSCSCRKPKPGMLETAKEKYDFDVENSLLISDSEKDVEMGNKFGLLHSILIPVDEPKYALEQIKRISL